MFVPRLLLQLTQLSPGLKKSGGSCGGGLISATIKTLLSQEWYRVGVERECYEDKVMKDNKRWDKQVANTDFFVGAPIWPLHVIAP